MKFQKITIILLVLSMIALMTACSDKDTNSSQTADSSDTPYEKHLLPKNMVSLKAAEHPMNQLEIISIVRISKYWMSIT